MGLQARAIEAQVNNTEADTALKIAQATMAGLAVKTYDSDVFQNWVNTELIEGSQGINEASSVAIVNDKLSMDALNLAQKVYDFLNRVAVSGNTYKD